MGTEHRRQFRHLIVDGDSRARQERIAALQGKDGLYLAGMYTCDVENHESATTSAVHLASLLAPRSPRLRLHAELRRAGWPAATFEGVPAFSGPGAPPSSPVSARL